MVVDAFVVVVPRGRVRFRIGVDANVRARLAVALTPHF